jgi:RNA polymerase sigma-70 factor (ECF subfamily)
VALHSRSRSASASATKPKEIRVFHTDLNRSRAVEAPLGSNVRAIRGVAIDTADHSGIHERRRRTPLDAARVVEAAEDRVLIVEAKGGDACAFRKLVERHQRRAFAIALALVRDERDAEEIVQEAFLRVYRRLDAFEGTSSFFTWLYRIVTNLSIDVLRKPYRREVDAIDPSMLEATSDSRMMGRFDESDPEHSVRRDEIRRRIEVALHGLPDYHRGVIVMREVEGLSYEEMAVVMGVSKGTIMSRLFHARRKLQKALAECYEEQIGAVPLEDAEGADAP